MLDFLGPIGGVSGKDCSLEFGNVGLSNCVYLSIKDLPDVVPTVVYTPDELESLLKIVEVGVAESGRTKAGTVLRLGAMSAKPITLRLALIHPHQGPPFLLLRFLQDPWSQDFTVPAEDLLRLLKMGRVKGPPSVSGAVKKIDDGQWSIGTDTLSLLEGLSPGMGFYGEYLHPDEVEDGAELEVWPFEFEGRNFVAAFRLKNRWKKPDKVDEPTGQEGDVLLSQGQTYRALHRYRTLGESQMKSRKVVAPWAAKATLGALLCELKNGDDQAAQKIWLGRSDDPFQEIGLKALEAGQAEAHDTALFQQVSAYFHSLNPETEPARSAVNGIMSSLFEHYKPEETDLRRLTLSNWYLHLREIDERPPDQPALQEWNKAKSTFPHPVVPKTLRFPLPSPWVMDDQLVNISAASGASAPVASPASSAPTASKEPPTASSGLLVKGIASALVILLLFFGLKPSKDKTSSTSHGPPRITMPNKVLLLDGKPVFEKPPKIAEVRRRLGAPSKDLSPKPHSYYVFSNGGDRSVLEVVDLSWMGPEAGVAFILESAENKFTEYEPIDLVKRIEEAK